MMFSDRSVHQITTSEISDLVTAQEAERQDLEFKATIDLDTNRDEACLEILEDIVAMANGGGGYIVVGISEQRGTNRASGFFPITSSEINRIHQKVSDWTVQHIEERIAGLELSVRKVGSSWVLLIHVPASGKPHMVTFQHGTKFTIRHGDRKREMKIGEIRSAFNDDYSDARLARLEYGLRNIGERLATSVKSAAPPANVFDASTARDAFITRSSVIEKSEKKLFWLAASPQNLSLEAVDLNAADVLRLLQLPPGQRSSGWNIQVVSGTPSYGTKGELRLGDGTQGLILYPNGFMEFLIDLDYFNHNESVEKFAESPILYPFAVVEFPVSFIRLYAEISKFISPAPDLIQITAGFFGISNARLFAGHPQSFAYGSAMYSKPPFPDSALIIEPPIKTPPKFKPDPVAYKLICEIYKRFGHSEDRIPFFNDQQESFDIA